MKTSIFVKITFDHEQLVEYLEKEYDIPRKNIDEDLLMAFFGDCYVREVQEDIPNTEEVLDICSKII